MENDMSDLIFVFDNFACADDAQAFAMKIKVRFGLDARFDLRFGAGGGPIIRVAPVSVGHMLPGGDRLIDASYVEELIGRLMANGRDEVEAAQQARVRAIEHAIQELGEEHSAVLVRSR
jgi:hypothetical protein